MLCLTLLPIHTRPANRRFSFIGVLSSARCPFRCRRPSAPSRRSRLRAVGRVSVPLPAPTGAGNGTDCTHCRSSLCVLQCLRDLLSGSLSLSVSLSLSLALSSATLVVLSCLPLIPCIQFSLSCRALPVVDLHSTF